MGARGVARTSAVDRRRAGFSLIELMTVVTITGILASLAIPTFQGYIMKSRTSEAPQMLGMIKLRQEAYKGEFSQYLQINGNSDPTDDPDAMDYNPGDATVMGGSATKPFPDDCATCYPDDWNTLGVNPGGYVRFGYGIAAGDPSNAPTGDPYLFQADNWYIARAVADLDGDTQRCMFEVYSQSNKVYYAPAKGWE